MCIFRRTFYLFVGWSVWSMSAVKTLHWWWHLLISALHQHTIPWQHNANASVSARNIASLKTLKFYQFFHFCVWHWYKLFTDLFLPITLSPVHVFIHSYSILNLLMVIPSCLWSHSRFILTILNLFLVMCIIAICTAPKTIVIPISFEFPLNILIPL